jgi:hypothetical protein
MKAYLPLWLALSTLLCAQQGGVRIKKSVTDEELTQRRMQAIQNKPVAPHAPPKGTGVAAAKPIPGLMSRSDTLSFNGLMTLVPKRAIVHQPPGFEARVNQIQPGSKIVGWRDFLQNNRGWVTTVDVSLAQAEGRIPMDEKVVELYKKGSNLVIATYRGGPISVLPQKTPDADASAATKKQNETVKPSP